MFSLFQINGIESIKYIDFQFVLFQVFSIGKLFGACEGLNLSVNYRQGSPIDYILVLFLSK